MERHAQPKLNAPTREFLSGSIAFVISAAALCVLRLINFFFKSGTLFSSTALEDIFYTLIIQVGIILIPAILFLFFLSFKKNAVKTQSALSLSRVPIRLVLLAIVLGVFVLIVNSGVSYFWSSILAAFGYTSPPASYNETFNGFEMAVDLICTAVFPAICEEVFFRGNILHSMRQGMSDTKAIVLSALAFSLFHMNIRQTLYTFLFGLLTAYLVVRFRSIWLPIIIHFINNLISAYSSWAIRFRMLGAEINDFLLVLSKDSPLFVFLLYISCVALLIGTLFLMTQQSKEKQIYKPLRGIDCIKPSVEKRSAYMLYGLGGAIALGVTVWSLILGLLRTSA